MTPDLAIIIPHYNDVTRLQGCLEALEGQDLSGVETVVADNASTQDLDAVKARFDWVRFVTQPEAGAGLARNAGVAATTAPWLAFIDADCVAASDWVAQAKRISAGAPDTVTGGRISVFDETPAPRSGSEALETIFAFDQESYIKVKGFSVTANLVASRQMAERVGGFRIGVSEDLDWCHRATAQGAVLRYDAALVVSHPTRSDWAALAKKWRRLTVEEKGVVRAQGGGRWRIVLKAVAMPISIVAHLPRILRHPALSGPEKARASATLVRLRLARMVWMIQSAR